MERGRIDLAIHLVRGQCEGLGEGVAALDEFRQMSNRLVPGRLVGRVDDHCEEAGSHERRNSFAHDVEPVLEPLCGGCEAWMFVDLPKANPIGSMHTACFVSAPVFYLLFQTIMDVVQRPRSFP